MTQRLSLFALFATTLILTGLARAATDDGTPAAPKAATPGKAVGQMITLSDFGAEDLAYLAIPMSPPTLGIVLVPDAYGLDDFTKAEADRLANLGYLVVAVDIYNGRKTTDPGDLANLIANLNAGTVMKTVDSGIKLFHESPKFHVGHVVAMGWGTGATYVFQADRENKGLDGAITFYGPFGTREHLLGKFVAPLCAVYSDRDPSVPRADVLAFQQQMKAEGNDCSAWFVGAGSGWSNPQSKNYNPAEDKEAWKVALPFLVRIDALPVKAEKGPSILDKAKDKIQSFFQ